MSGAEEQGALGQAVDSAAPPVRAERIAMLGLIISDKNEQPFSLEVDWIRGYTEEREI